MIWIIVGIIIFPFCSSLKFDELETAFDPMQYDLRLSFSNDISQVSSRLHLTLRYSGNETVNISHFELHSHERYIFVNDCWLRGLSESESFSQAADISGLHLNLDAAIVTLSVITQRTADIAVYHLRHAIMAIPGSIYRLTLLYTASVNYQENYLVGLSKLKKSSMDKSGCCSIAPG